MFRWDPIKKRKYVEAAQNKYYSERREAEYRIALNRTKSKLNSCKSQIAEYKLRIDQVEDIIDLMTKSGKLFKNTVVGEIEDTKKNLNNVNSSYSSCIKVNGLESGSIIEKFEFETVTGNDYSRVALDEYIKEKNKLENEMAEATRNKTNLENSIASINADIKKENDTQDEMWVIMLRNCF